MHRRLARTLASMSVGALTAALAAVVVPMTTPASAAPAVFVVTEETAIARAEVALRTEREALAATEADEFHVVRTIVDPDGASHVRYARTYQGLPVYGGDIVVHNRPDGSYADSSVGLAAPLRLDVRPAIAKKDATATAISHFTGDVETVTDPVLVIEAADGFGRLAYETVVSGIASDKQTPSVLHVLVDAIIGEVIRSTDEVETLGWVPVDGTGHTNYSGTVTLHATRTWEQYIGFRYYLIDQVAGGSVCDMGNGTGQCSTAFLDMDGVWGDGTLANRQTAAADAHYGAAMAFDYFKNVHGHSGILGDGSIGPSRVHYGDGYDNAFWQSSTGMTFGDGYDNQHPYVSLDVVGHEATHGVTQALAGLIPSGESGALNEATSDIFATAIEFHAANPNDPGDYGIGEEVDIFGTGGAMRYLFRPWPYGCYSGYGPSVPVHAGMGPVSHFFFNLAEGSGVTQYGTSALCDNAPPVVGIGLDAAAQIWFRALNVHFIDNTSIGNPATPANTARAHTLKAAADLYGWCSPQVKAVHAAWVSVGVPGSLICSKLELDLDHLVVLAGETGTVTIQTHADPHAEPVTLMFSVSGLPDGTKATFDPEEAQAGDKVAMTVTVPTFARPGSYQVTVTASSRDGSDSVPLPLTVVDRRYGKQRSLEESGDAG